MSLKERLPSLLSVRRSMLITGRDNAADPQKDQSGTASSLLMRTLRFIGIADFVVSGNIAFFKQYLSDAAKLRLRLFERRLDGEAIDDSYLAMLSYEQLFDALAAGDFGTAEQLAKQMGGRPELETVHDHLFDRCLGYTLKAFVLRAPREMGEWAANFTALCRESDNRDFSGYAEVFNGILAGDDGMVQAGLLAIVKGHKNQIKRGGIFHETVDELLCVWGIGIANLARHDRLAVQGTSPLIPQELLV